MDNNTTVILELDRPRELRCGHKALKKFSAMTQCAMDDLQNKVRRYDMLTALLYCMLSADDVDVTVSQVDDWLDRPGVKLKDVIEAVAKAVAAAFGDDDDAPGDGEETPPEAAGTGEKA